MGAAAYSAVGLIAGCMVASMVLVGWSMYQEYSRNRKSTVKYSAHDRGRRAFWRDMTWISNGEPCACCGGQATKALHDPETGLVVCTDRKLCQATMAFKSELDSMT